MLPVVQGLKLFFRIYSTPIYPHNLFLSLSNNIAKKTASYILPKNNQTGVDPVLENLKSSVARLEQTPQVRLDKVLCPQIPTKTF